MKEEKFEFSYKVYTDITELPEQDQLLLQAARDVTEQAYAPYSQFQVGAIARLVNGEIVAGTNQENASFPIGLCAERVLLASASSIFPNVPVESIAVSYRGKGHNNDRPISPCGICRQALQEMESRAGKNIQLILGGITGSVYVIGSVGALLPLAFSSEELK
ncbi:MAG: cytidine deaminase [Chitinophagaceae bacterium]